MGEKSNMGKTKKLVAFLLALHVLVHQTVCLILIDYKVEDIYSEVIQNIPSLRLRK